ncbi:methyltransferase family protein [Mesorhizobium sp. L-8-3]|uniref:methyltransferase family protein n=1 Tax=Mesorhizobium sp. L-8-3 TaxID=2744522 RepID=UPI00192690AA|nr:isoprenylcysteine carboxylmethyltransferase family protein [Mesorhizobium sp. L-8-3]BCH25186.1 hypothetical protein MesoLjLb_49710 [Mesorhizobium sp. L-8-3]
MLSLDFIGRASLAGLFTGYVCLNLISIMEMTYQLPRSETFALDVTARSAGLIFMGLAVGLTVLRLPPKNDSLGWMPRLVAIAGTFMTLTLIVLPQVDIPPVAKLTATTLTIVGTTSSAYCLAWLGRSFSIDAQARRLVTEGPYAIVRHPLYVCEAITLLGVALSNFSAWSVLIVSINLAVQYWRIANEERVLGQAFPEYASYARVVPQLMPRLRKGSAQQRL